MSRLPAGNPRFRDDPAATRAQHKAEWDRREQRPPMPETEPDLWWDGFGYHPADRIGPWGWRVEGSRWGALVRFRCGPCRGGEIFTSPASPTVNALAIHKETCR